MKKKLYSETLLKLDSDNEFIYRVVKVVAEFQKEIEKKKWVNKDDEENEEKKRRRKRETIVSEEENCSNSLKCDVRLNWAKDTISTS